MIQVKGCPNLFRDEKTGAIINTSNIDYDNRLNTIKKSQIQKNELDKMRSDIDELKYLLSELLKKSTS